ncbi:hypothetical protein RND71_030249 [Anisodus tanguticus]|uniref:Uncharacterized protein n=1 Tax=Anisodus tanguticus TaxID=243964 RepID=A0AAE1V5B8_9SOLA|nr:hypothetical protein RND71_030249 [Anisodus tanguticus]
MGDRLRLAVGVMDPCDRRDKGNLFQAPFKQAVVSPIGTIFSKNNGDVRPAWNHRV